MKLHRVELRNFKLLDGVIIELSTDSSRPLTVIRAENGSGKTSLLWALAWAFYGDDGLPSKKSRLTSTRRPSGEPTTVQVIIDFEHDPDGLGVNQYVLTRTVEETPGDGNEVEHGPMNTKLIVRKPAGDERVPGDTDAVLEQFVPKRLKDVFLTDGDKVQRFISGTVAAKERQFNVHQAIRALLGLDRLEEVETDLVVVEKLFRKEMAETGGQDVQQAQVALDACENSLAEERGRREKSIEKRSRIEEDIDGLDRRLREIQGHGDLDAINTELLQAAKELKQAEDDGAALLESIRLLFKTSEDLSWSLAGEPLRQGQKVLSDLADRGIIPGSSIGVLRDRLDQGTCICGESLAEGDEHRAHVIALVEQQSRVSDEQERLTATFHRTRAGLDNFKAACEDGRDFWSMRPKLLQRHADIADRTKEATQRLTTAEAKRAAIDDEEIHRFTARLQEARKDLVECSEEIGGLDRDITTLDENRIVLASRYETAQKAAKSDAKARHRHAISSDLKDLVSDSLRVLKTEHIHAVSERMNTIFMEIVGSAPELAGAVFKGVHLTENFDIIVDAGNKKTLDTDYEVNGASQRALTLAFIWGLMEVSAIVAPRVIDTPLGMTAGGVKRRMVKAITEPVNTGDVEYQVILLLTRSEIRDIEDILDERTGHFVTLSGSKDYPMELVNDWGASEPIIRSCHCSHRQFCDICERRNDADYQLSKRV
jgi:DNA sulfur modification protein DndD